MIHYTCDCCRRPLDPDSETRYLVRVEVYATPADAEGENADQRDHLEEIQEILEQIDAAASEGDFKNVSDEELEAVLNGEGEIDPIYQQLRFDLCQSCRQQFLDNPMGRVARSHVGFSKN